MKPSSSRWLAALAVILSAVTLGYSYTLPTVTFQALLKPEETYSIWGGIVSLWEDGNWFLAPVVFLFSMVFPIGKLLCLALVLTPLLHERVRGRWLAWLHLLGKWSLLDVFIVGVFVAAVQLNLIAMATSRWGIHVFTLAVLMSMASAWWVGRLEGVIHRASGHARLRTWTGKGLASARALALAGVLFLPLLEVKKVLFGGFESSNQVHLWHTTSRLAREGELLLALVLGLFLIVVPAARALCSLRLRWFGGEGRLALRLARGLDAWAMVDVFGLGLLIVQVKLAELTSTHLMAGFWVTLLAAASAQAESWHLRRACR